jgi:hypothetical protein
MNGSQFWKLYQSYGDVYRQEVLDEEVEVEEGYVDAYKAPNNYRRPQGSSMLGHPANLSPAMRAMQKSDELQKTEPGSKRQKTQTRSSQQLNRLYGSARRAGKVNASYEYDLYDVVLEHLLDEGFADTLEDAQVLMANMSEQWIDSIVEARVDDNKSPIEKAKQRNKRDSQGSEYFHNRPGFQTQTRRETNRNTRGVTKKMAGLPGREMSERPTILNYRQKRGETNKPDVNTDGKYLRYYQDKQKHNTVGTPLLDARRAKRKRG